MFFTIYVFWDHNNELEVDDDTAEDNDPEVNDELEVNDQLKRDIVKYLIKSLKAGIKERRAMNEILENTVSSQKKVIQRQEDVIRKLVEIMQNTGRSGGNDELLPKSEMDISLLRGSYEGSNGYYVRDPDTNELAEENEFQENMASNQQDVIQEQEDIISSLLQRLESSGFSNVNDESADRS
ncbi:uncharacterized protein LOC110839396 isoform X2 [Zootermopsis nevadensis]|uniref:uncharacterized protein LOC110839396 isoform X2 n=1 Tax=Zootermopsis nevadensis TaxID=136037 RepID=UPI000B8ED0B1|nr:uncharacterized protein LOC110839396 isoform X2 [Zootermopsis nevadensis]